MNKQTEQQQISMVMGLMATAKQNGPLNLVVNDEPMSLVYIEPLNKYVLDKQIKRGDEVFDILFELVQNKNEITVIEN